MRRRCSSRAAAADVFSSSGMIRSSATEDFTPPDASHGISHPHREPGAWIGRDDGLLDVVAFLEDLTPHQGTALAIDDFHRHGALRSGVPRKPARSILRQ